VPTRPHRDPGPIPRAPHLRYDGPDTMPHRAIALLLVLLLTVPAEARAAPEAAPSTGVLTRAPTLLEQVEARFPAEAAEQGLAGTVVMEVDIGADGRVLEVRVVQPAGHGFDEAAVEAVRQFLFTPAEVDGQPAPVRIQYAYEFLYRPQVEEVPPAPTEEVVNFTGVLLERGTRKALAGATVVVDAGGEPLEAVSDEAGRFEMRGVPAGTWPVVVLSGPEHQRYQVTESFTEGQRTEATYYVRRKQYGALETVVRGKAERKEVAQVSLRQEEVRLIPGTQGDALKVVQNLPGVARSPFGAGLLVVRGGKPYDTRVYVDDELVPQLFHFGGLFATFNSNLLEDISFQPGNFGVGYGRNIGGLVRAATRTPARDGLHGYVDINLIDSSALLEGPLGGDWSLAVAGRRSYVDAVLPWALDTFAPPGVNALSFTVAPRYYDYQVKLERRPGNGRERLSLTFFGSNDRLSLVLSNPAFDAEARNNIDTLQTYNRLAFRWDKPLSGRLTQYTRASLGFDRTDLGAGMDLYVRSQQVPLSLRHSYTLEMPEQNLTLSAGLDMLLIPRQQRVQVPPPFRLNQIPDPFVSRRLVRVEASRLSWEPGLYLEAVWQPLEGVRLVPGVRADYQSALRQAWVDPRLAAFWQLTGRTTLKGAAGLFRQSPDYRRGQLSPTFGNPALRPEGSRHFALGAEHQLTEALGVDVQAYYQRLFDQVQSVPVQSAGADADANASFFANTGRGRSYGVELLLRHQLTRNFFGWIAYSLSRTELRDALTGRMRRGPFDQPHNVVAVASYKLPHDFIAGVRLRYSSGPLSTPIVGSIYDANANYYFPLPGERFSRRLPDFFQADVRVDKRFVHERWMLALYLDVQNVTNRQNVEGMMNNFDYSQERHLYGLPILPSLGIRGEF
jgi:TonB family protein